MLWLRSLLLAGVVFLACAADAAQLKLKKLQVGSRTFTGVTVLGANTTDVYFKHDEGIANIKLKYLSEDLQRRFNYDAQAATEAERQQAEDDSRYQMELAATLAEEVRKRAAQTNSVSISPFCDAISDKSLVGKAAPSLDLEQWTGDEPATAGKFVLAYFWAPWSEASRKYLPEIHGLQKAFPEALRVVGVLTELNEDRVKEAAPGFSSGVDSKARLFTAAGITTVPQVLLWDTNGIVRYQGHPGALSVTNLTSLLKPQGPPRSE